MNNSNLQYCERIEFVIAPSNLTDLQIHQLVCNIKVKKFTAGTFQLLSKCGDVFVSMRMYACVHAYGWGWLVIPASSCISYTRVLVRVPPRGSDYTGSSEKALTNAPAFKGSFSQSHSKQSAQSGSAHPAQIPSWLSEELRAGPAGGKPEMRVGFAHKGLWKGCDTCLFMPQ